VFFFFFSSRRRHTRSKRDWSSDVCSSDLSSYTLPVPTRRPSIQIDAVVGVVSSRRRPVGTAARRGAGATGGTAVGGRAAAAGPRSEERRVGKEGRARGETEQ